MILIHLIEREDWESAREENPLFQKSFIQFGFVHCCLPDQTESVLSQWFAGNNEVIAVEIDSEKLKFPLVFENLEGGNEDFPHIYGPVNIDAIVKSYPVSQQGD